MPKTIGKNGFPHWQVHIIVQEWISTLVSAYNSTVSNATGFSPYFLMYGCHPWLPIDIEFGVTQVDISGPTLRIMLRNIRPGSNGHIKWPKRLALENQKDTNDTMITNSVASPWPQVMWY